MSAFAKLKKNRSNKIAELRQEAEKVSGGKKDYGDDRFWKPTRDKAGNAQAIIRFLPAAEGEDVPWVRFWDHGFQGPGGRWYIENSLTSIGQDDPVSDLNSEVWNRPGDAAAKERDKAKVRDRKRRLHYVANILVVKDPAKPENEGKVMLYKFGKKIFDKIQDIMQPEFDDEEPVNPFDFWEGANFRLKVRKVEGWVNYDKSEFDKPSELLKGDDTKLEELYNGLHKLSEFTDPKNYKTYAELKTKLVQVLGDEADIASSDADEPTAEAEPEMASDTGSEDLPSAGADDEDDVDYFKNLADED